MSVDIGRIGGADAILEAAARVSAREELSNVEIDLDGTRSSSLSEIEYKESNHEEEGNFSDNQEDNSEEENDSEAETERLEDSPVKLRAHKDVVMNSHSSLIYDRSPSQLNHQTIPPREPDEEDDDEPLSDEEVSPNDSPKSSVHGDDVVSELPVGPISLEDSAGEGKRTLSVPEIESRKRKRSIMAGNGLDEDIEEPMRKRTGEVSTIGDDYAVEDSEQIEEDQEGDLSNPISGNISDENGGEVQVDIPLPLVPSIQEVNELINAPISPKKRGRKKKKGTDNNAGAQEDDQGKPPTAETQQDGNGGDNNPQNAEDDEAEAALRNEEELGRKRIALDQLSLIEKQFATFRDRLFDERLAQLNREEAMLREDKPTHPEYLAMMQAVDERRDEKIRLANKLREYEWQTLENFAVATRSQVLVQYKQEVREIREKTIEQLGTQWYEIQHDRRSYAGNVPDYTLQFPTRRSQQISHQVAYSNEVSILSGVAKYVGFPSAPTMAKVTDAEFLEDMEKMGRTRHPQAYQPTTGLHELAALRTAGNTRSKPAEEQFIEQTPWANPQHPSHAHRLQRQASAQQIPKTASTLGHVQSQPRRYSHQHNIGPGPISGIFSNSSTNPASGPANAGPSILPHNPFSNSALPHTIAPSPLGGSMSPQQNNRQPSAVPTQLQHTPAALINGV